MTRTADPVATRLDVSGGVRRALTGPLATMTKRAIKDLWWRAKGRGLSNPPLPEHIRSILFVCSGNICRSPFAALAAERLLERATDRPVKCTSAGLRTSSTARPPREACEAAEACGLSLNGHVPLQLTEELVGRHDLVVAMEASQVDALRSAYPSTAPKVFLLPLAGKRKGDGYSRFNIADPYGRPRAAFDECYRRIEEDVASLLRQARLL